MSTRTMVGIAILACTALPAMGDEAAQTQATENAFANLRQYKSERMCPREGHRFWCKALRRVEDNATLPRAGGAPSGGLGADDLAKAYNLDTSIDPHATIAVVDAFHYPNADKDLQVYRAAYNLPPCTVANGCFKIVNQSGQASPLPTQTNSGWAGETALDLDMASAACPKCKIILVEADDDQGDGLNLGQAGAAAAGANVISDSWGGAETAGQTGLSQEHFFMLSAPVTIFIASGDAGYDNGDTSQGGSPGPDYPSTSQYVIGVGGTSLMQDSSTRGWSEQVWSGGGSSCGGSVAKPSWQMGVTTDCANRAAADVAAVADPATGVASYNGRWGVVGGTSAAAPLVAGIFAVTGKSGVAPSWVYQNTSIWNDVTQGNNDQHVTGQFGCPSATSVLCYAGKGWDGPTGWGTPNGALMAKTSGGNMPPDMATPPDMTIVHDLAPPPPPPDLAQPASGGGGSGGSGGGVGGNGNNPGNGYTGGNKGCGCTLGGATENDRGSLVLGGLLLAFVGLIAARGRRRS